MSRRRDRSCRGGCRRLGLRRRHISPVFSSYLVSPVVIYIEERGGSAYTTRITTNGIMSTTMNAQMLLFRKPLHYILEGADLGIILNQAQHIARLGPCQRDISRDIATQTTRVIIQPIPALGFKPRDFQTGRNGTKVHGHTVKRTYVQMSN